ncbi:ABC transporter substrate-binding protein [Streptomyces sp. CNQ085]|uniref:ABC transporter substrate-binding protein n=1 Tax=Streptomyces sp. CNQ085 TaxID=2886944 RepID=UPI001F511B0E|nr:ABC transporter substrate-binding protein [Streptomyces sp. CNQ085]MCI0383907.1 ABC transporter substrate-binding protein [Streptomyces sp. CNQ085]
MRKRARFRVLPVGTALVAALLTGCGDQQGTRAGEGGRIVMGMTDEVLAVDPASGYDPGSWLIFNNVFQSLLSFPRNGGEPQPEAARGCEFTDDGSQVFRCVLRDGLKFTNGNPLTSKDVKFSFERTLRIDDPDGPAVMLSGIEEIETPDAGTVVFRLGAPDATFPQKIASGAGSIVDHRFYPADELRTDGKAVGSGVYRLDSYGDEEAVFSVNPDYLGPAQVKNSGMTMKLFHGDQVALRRALSSGEVDLAYRGLAMDDIADLDAAASAENGVEVVEGTSAEVHHLVFNMEHPVTGKPGVRKAIAYLLDRSTLIRDVHRRTAEPLYSIVPAGVTGHNTAFFDAYGSRPQPGKAKGALRAEGITEKVELTLWATPVRYGPATVREFEEIAQQLNASGLFDAKVESVELEEYEKGVEAGEYGVYVKGWVPDYPDADNFTAPFFGEDNVLGNGYDAGRITSELLPRTAAASDRAATVKDFGEIQDIVARDLPVLPVWQGKQYAVAHEDVSGLEWTLDASTVFRFWEIGKGAGG